MGRNEPPISDPAACGLGQSGCCAFLVMDQEGYHCARYTNLGYVIKRKVKLGLMTATRTPVESRPTCQIYKELQ